MKDKKILEEVKNFIVDNQENFPFISNFWDLTVIIESNERDINYGCFQTSSDKHSPFYKPYSSIIDFSKLNEK